MDILSGREEPMIQHVASRKGPFKVLVPIYGLKGGGAERVVVTLLNHLDRTLFEPVLVLLDGSGDYLHQIHPNVRVIHLYENLTSGKSVEPGTMPDPTDSQRAGPNLYERVRTYVREMLPSPWVDAYRKIKRNPGVMGLHEASTLTGKGIWILARGVRRMPRLLGVSKMWTKRMITRYWETFHVWRDTLRLVTRLQPHFERLLERERPDAIVAHLLLANSLALQTGPARGIFTVVCIHNTLKDYQTREEFRKSPLEKADVIVTVSHAIREIFHKKFGEEKVRVIHNPHDLRRIQNLAMEPVLHPWFVQKDLPIVMGMGRLSRQKNFALLVEAVCALNRNGACPVRLVLFGEGPDRKRLMRLIRKSGQEERIQLMGWTANPFSYLSRADLFVLCSNWEGLPNTLIEAMACGVPVISTDCQSGPREIIQNGRCGKILAQGDVNALREAVEEMLRNSKRTEAFSMRGKEKAWVFDISMQVPCYEKMILEGVEQKRNRAGR